MASSSSAREIIPKCLQIGGYQRPSRQDGLPGFGLKYRVFRQGTDNERVGVAFDGSDEARGAFEYALALVQASGAELRIISVFEPMSFRALATGRTGGASVIELLRRRAACSRARRRSSSLPKAWSLTCS
jgi:Universal stress protein family